MSLLSSTAALYCRKQVLLPVLLPCTTPVPVTVK
jgi:hypothetical protein